MSNCTLCIGQVCFVLDSFVLAISDSTTIARCLFALLCTVLGTIALRGLEEMLCEDCVFTQFH